MRSILFSHGRALGDCLMFTAGVRDFKLLFPDIQVGVNSDFPELWHNNPYVDYDLPDDCEHYRVGYPIINNANSANTHFTQGFLFDMIASADNYEKLPISLGEFCAAFANGRVGDPELGDKLKNKEAKEPYITLHNKYDGFCKNFARIRGDLHLSKEELDYDLIKDIFKVDKYWVIAPGGKRDCTCKIWDWRRFQKVIDYYQGQIQFVTIGRSDHLVEKLNGVIDLTDKFNKNLRGLLSLVHHAEGFVSGVTFLMHLAAALPPRKIKSWGASRKPGVVIYGGREPHTFTGYNEQQILHTCGAFSCCDMGGCWHSRVIPLQKSRDLNKRLCETPVISEGKSISSCMNVITADDVIRALNIYYEGDLYSLENKKEFKRSFVVNKPKIEVESNTTKEINILASLQSRGGGERSSLKIAEILYENGWKVNLYPWGKVHSDYKGIVNEPFWKDDSPNLSFLTKFKKDIPLLFYANDQIWDFVKYGKEVVDSCSKLVVSINYANGGLPSWRYPVETGKLKAIIFQNVEKRKEFEVASLGYESVELITLFGAIDIEKFIKVLPPIRKPNQPLVVLKHGLPDYRKYVTRESQSGGDRKHLWQHKFYKELDIDFYSRLIHDLKDVRFEFMEAHPEIVEHFKNEPKMKFYKFNEIPVEEFLSKGHVYLHRMSNKWRDQYPRVVAEALAAGLPVITEPRDGTLDRVSHGNTGFHCVQYDEFALALRTLMRKEDARQTMGMYAKDWARQNLDPREWAWTLNRVLL